MTDEEKAACDKAEADRKAADDKKGEQRSEGEEVHSCVIAFVRWLRRGYDGGGERGWRPGMDFEKRAGLACFTCR